MKREINLYDLPKTSKGIDWKKSVGHRCSFIYGDIKGELEILDYKTQKVKIKYLDNVLWMLTDSVLNAKLGVLIGAINTNYIYSVGHTMMRKGCVISIIDRKTEVVKYESGNKKNRYYQILCNACAKTHWILESLLKIGAGCPYCVNHSSKLFVGVNDIATTDPWMIKFFQNPDDAKKYRKTSNHKIYPICPICHKIQEKEKPIKEIYRLGGCGCSCENKMSFSEMVMCNIFDQYNIVYIKELSKSVFPWVDKYRYDFYLPDQNIIVETHGVQHYRQTTLGHITLHQQKLRDELKRDLAIKNGISGYYIINCCNPSIKNIIKSCEDVGLFELLKINPQIIDCSKLKYNKLLDDVNRCSEILKDNPSIKYADLKRLCGIKHSYDLDRILDILNICIQHNNMPVYVYDNLGLIKTYRSKSSLCRDNTEYKISSITNLNKYIDTGILYKNKYIFSSTALSADDILELYHTPATLTSNGVLMTSGEFTGA